MIFSVKLLEKNEGIFENELPGKIVCMGLAFTVAFFLKCSPGYAANKNHLTTPCFSSFSADSVFSSFSSV